MPKTPALFAALTLLVVGVGCETVCWSVAGIANAHTPRDWLFIQSMGGIAIGKPQRLADGHVSLPIRCDVSGTEIITVHPTRADSFLVCDPPSVSVSSGTVLLTICTSLASDTNSNARCSAADLGTLAAGQYSVAYLGPDGSRQPLGLIQVARQ